MCDLVEAYGRECAEKVTKQATLDTENNARRLFENGVAYDIVRASIPSLSDETLQRIYDEVKKGK